MKLIDAGRLKEALAEKFVSLQRQRGIILNVCDECKEWQRNALTAMNTVDKQPEVLLSCAKCHGTGEYKKALIEPPWVESSKCLICNGTGKVSVEQYEDYQSKRRG